MHDRTVTKFGRHLSETLTNGPSWGIARGADGALPLGHGKCKANR